jgi:hypothetical protein
MAVAYLREWHPYYSRRPARAARSGFFFSDQGGKHEFIGTSNMHLLSAQLQHQLAEDTGLKWDETLHLDFDNTFLENRRRNKGINPGMLKGLLKDNRQGLRAMQVCTTTLAGSNKPDALATAHWIYVL